MDQKNVLYGTCLTKAIYKATKYAQYGPSSSKDTRQRFHGAFTGGFSAGYFNSVGTTEGFQPKTFFTSRTHRHDEQSREASSFSHKPEDYMDEEDLSEFGIAPKRIRINAEFSGHDEVVQSSYCERESNINYHGLGYESLKVQRKETTKHNNPLIAEMKDGQTIHISGEAFGSGVLDDDDQAGYDSDGAWIYDSIHDYYESGKNSNNNKKSKKYVEEEDIADVRAKGYLPGFVRQKKDFRLQVEEAMSSQIQIPRDWKPPTRKPEVTNQKESSSVDLGFSLQFVSGERLQISSSLHQKQGRIDYDDLKKCDTTSSNDERVDEEKTSHIKATINRVVNDWYPCTLLCKRFGVSDPHPKREEKREDTSKVEDKFKNHDKTDQAIKADKCDIDDQLIVIFNAFDTNFVIL